MHPVLLLILGLLLGLAAPTSAWSGSLPPDPPETTTLVDFDEAWLFWASDGRPAGWPLNTMPSKVSNVLTLLPEEVRADPDRVVDLRADGAGHLRTQGKWWSGTMGPYSIRTQAGWERSRNSWLNEKRKRARKKRAPFSRTHIIYPTEAQEEVLEPVATDGEAAPADAAPADAAPADAAPAAEPAGPRIPEFAGPFNGITNVYFVKRFQVDDPSSFVGMMAEAKFNKGIRVFLNGEEIARYGLKEGADGHGAYGKHDKLPYYIKDDIGASDRWQEAWMGIPVELLKKGDNVLAAVVHREEKPFNPPMYFDIKLTAWKDFGWVKAPYLQWVAQTAVTVSWETSAPSSGRVEILGQDGSVEIIYPSKISKNHHEVRLRGLNRSRSYTYRVMARTRTGKVIRTEPRTFRTAPGHGASFTFLLYGDSRGNPPVHRKIAQRMQADGLRHKAGFVVNVGDLVSYGYSWELWQKSHFWAGAPLFQSIPLYPVLGNHELSQRLYYDYFDLPNNESWYTFTYGNTDFFAINSNVGFSPKTGQYKWLEKELKKSDAKWKVAFLHHPAYSCTPSRKPGHRSVRNYLQPLFAKYGVDLVLLGHDHLYGRSKPIDGVTHITSGGGGSWLYPAETDETSLVCERKYNYVRFYMGSEQIKLTAIDIDGNVIETHTISQKVPAGDSAP